MAEALLRERLAVRGIDATTASVGFLFEGREAEDGAIRAMARRGIDLSAHRSRVLSEDLTESATLILAMERAQVRRAAEEWPAVFDKAFTLPEFVGSARVVGPRRAGQDLADWIRRIGASRGIDLYHRSARSADIADPMGRSRRTFRACADEIDALLEEFVDLAWPEAPPTDDHAVATPSSHGSS